MWRVCWKDEDFFDFCLCDRRGLFASGGLFLPLAVYFCLRQFIFAYGVLLFVTTQKVGKKVARSNAARGFILFSGRSERGWCEVPVY